MSSLNFEQFLFPGQSQQQEQRQNGGVANRLSFFIRNLPNQQQQQQQQPPRWEEYRLPPLWKRFAAEFIDFLFLVILKITITFMAVDWFDLIDLDRSQFQHFMSTRVFPTAFL